MKNNVVDFGSLTFLVVPPRPEEIDEMLGNPALKLRHTEREHLRLVKEVARFDPGVMRRIMLFRHKLNYAIRPTQAEVEEMLCVLRMKDFPLTDLDLSGMELPYLDLSNGRVGGDLDLENFAYRDRCSLGGNLEVRGKQYEFGLRRSNEVSLAEEKSEEGVLRKIADSGALGVAANIADLAGTILGQ